MVILARRVEHPFYVTVNRSHHGYTRKHRWPVMFGHQYQRVHCGLTFNGIVFGFRQLGDVQRGVAERDQRFVFGQFNRFRKRTGRRHRSCKPQRKLAIRPRVALDKVSYRFRNVLVLIAAGLDFEGDLLRRPSLKRMEATTQIGSNDVSRSARDFGFSVNTAKPARTVNYKVGSLIRALGHGRRYPACRAPS
jgi:hypothetical protein